MHTRGSIRLIKKIYKGNRIGLPEDAGVYAFWWLGAKKELLESNRQILLKGPGGAFTEVALNDWWPSELEYPCLYVGKSTNIKQRFSLHIKRNCKSRLHDIPDNNQKVKPATTSCQLRYGIEHIFKEKPNPLEMILSNVGFSYTTNFNKNAVAERFFTEDRLIGSWRPWFNIDSER